MLCQSVLSGAMKNLTFLLAWTLVLAVAHGPESDYPWAELFGDMANEVDSILPSSFFLNFQNDVFFKMGNETLDENRPFSKDRTSARHTPDTERIGRESNFNFYIYELMTVRYGFPRTTALRLLQKRLSPFCRAQTIACDNQTPYRSIDGKCNNLHNPYWGSSFREFERILPAAYEDGFNAPRGGYTNTRLPNPRLISTTIHFDEIKPDPDITNMVPQLGQFVDHDLTLAPEGDKHCCTTDRGNRDCWPIRIPDNDPFYSKLSTPQTCMDFTRSTPYCFPGGTGIREQFNILTSFLDASQVYGSEPERAEQIRTFSQGRLEVHGSNPDLLPTVKEIEAKTGSRIAFMGKYLAGDERVNEMPALTTMHILLVREHNRIANEISRLRPDWSDDQIFEESRRLVIAQWQNVVYSEYLPIILGTDTMDQFDIFLRDGYTVYNPNLNPTIFHAFATAAYRFGHTLINGIIQLHRGLTKVGSYPLKDNFFESEQVDQGDGDGYNLILNGLMVQNAQAYDPQVTEALTNFLLRNRSVDFGSDLIARNIQRGREHGIQPYAMYRRVCNLTPLTTWAQRPPEIPAKTWSLLKTLYRVPQDIDLFTGGLSEERVPNAYSGRTFNCLKAIQFHRTLYGDRFFFTHEGQTGSFTLDQLRHIRKRTLGDIICDNSKLPMTTQNVFRTFSPDTNPTIQCDAETRTKLDIELLIQKE